MNIKRQYTLPSCTLILEGLSDDLAASNGSSLMSILVNAECRFLGSARILNGGRFFWDSLVKAVSAYTQECLSGLRHPQDNNSNTAGIYLEKIPAKNLHRLIWQPPADDPNPEKVEIELTTVQLFDLVEAVDQFLADRLTLPELSLQLQPASRRYNQTGEPLVQKVAPAALGLTSLALAAGALFLMPPPEARKSEPKPESEPIPTEPQTNKSPTPTQPTTNNQ
jgi:hypothetical protein